MAHIDQNTLVKILTESPAFGKYTETIPWQPRCWINLDGNPQPQEIFQQVSHTLYIDMLINDTVDVVDYYIEKMMEVE